MGHMLHPKAASAINEAAKCAAFTHWFGLPRREAMTLTLLHSAKGNPLSAAQLATLGATTTCSITESIKHCRRALDPEAIDRDQRGYWLTEVGMSEITNALCGMARSLVA